MRPFISIFTIVTVAAASAGCLLTSRRVVAHRDLGQNERREGTCVSRGNARTGVEVLSDASIRIAVTVPCRQIYTTTAKSEDDVVEPSSTAGTANVLMGMGTALVGTGALVGLGNAMGELGGGFGGGGDGCSRGCNDTSEDSNSGSITALIGAGMIVSGFVVAVSSSESRKTRENSRVIDRRIATELRPGSQPVVVRAPIGPPQRVALDDTGRGLLRLPASVLAENDHDLLASILAQPWTLVIEGRTGSWTPTAAQVQRLLAPAVVASSAGTDQGAF